MEIQHSIDALLEEHTDAELFSLVLERRRKMDHAKAKHTQPAVGVQIDAAGWEQIEKFAHAPIGEHEQGQGGLDHLTMTVVDCIRTHDADDLLFALLRAWRKSFHLQPHLGPITGGKP